MPRSLRVLHASDRVIDQRLQRFQRTQEAWSTANELLLAQELPLESRLFAAQTFRSKVRATRA